MFFFFKISILFSKICLKNPNNVQTKITDFINHNHEVQTYEAKEVMNTHTTKLETKTSTNNTNPKLTQTKITTYHEAQTLVDPTAPMHTIAQAPPLTKAGPKQKHKHKPKPKL